MMLIGLIGISGLAVGCHDSAPPPHVPVPSAGNPDAARTYRSDPVKPLPPPRMDGPADYPPFDDVPLLSQQLPEQPAFVDAYRKVGSPKISVVVNRVTDASQKGGVGTSDIDFDAVESIITDWISCGGQVTILARNRNASPDILIQVNAQTTRQTAAGKEIRMVAEAVNTRGGESIARATVDIHPPLEKTTINRYTRFVARKLIDGMLNTWSAPQPAAPPTPASLLPTTQP